MMGIQEQIESRAKLIGAALDVVRTEIGTTFTLPGPYDDAEAELLDDRLLITARAYVAAHADRSPIPG